MAPSPSRQTETLERPVTFPRFGEPAGPAKHFFNRVLGLFSPYHRGRAAIQNCPLALAQALRRCVLTRDRRLLFLKNPKAACSTVLSLIHQHELGRSAAPDQLHRTNEIMQGLRHSEALFAALDDPNCVRFTVVRDPASRAVSGFMMFFSGAGAEVFTEERNKKAAKREAGMWALGYDPKGDSGRNFDIFLEYLARCFATGPELVNVHWKPQTLSIAHGHIRYTRIGRMESLQRDLVIVGEKLGYDLVSAQAELPRVNRSRSGGPAFNLTKEQRRKIRELYADDYAAFGY
jgi:hypothetical protein